MKGLGVVILVLCNFLISAQRCETIVVGFYNLENLYDTLDDPFKNDDDFTPAGSYGWTGDKYWVKISHLARVINEMGTEFNADGPALIGLCEVENKSVLQDLVSDAQLKGKNYQVILIEGPDARGVDPALIYQSGYFHISEAASFPVYLKDSTHRTRDILMVKGKLCDEQVAVFVNHWPSRRGGELRSRESRNIAGRRVKSLADSVRAANPGIRTILMGDLNDDPVNDCVKKCVGTYSKIGQMKNGLYFNPMENLFRRGIGTLAYQDSWNLFDQILLSEEWVGANYPGYKYADVRINNKLYLRADYGNFKGYPFRTYSGGIYTAGYSDHFASYVVLKR